MVLVWFALGMIIDSISIMLLTAAIFAPIAVSIGYDPIAFAIIAIIAIEAGLYTPPFGLLLFVMHGVSPRGTTLQEVARAALPYILCVFLLVALVIAFPILATLIPSLM